MDYIRIARQLAATLQEIAPEDERTKAYAYLMGLSAPEYNSDGSVSFPLIGGYTVYVDEADFEVVRKYKWSPHIEYHTVYARAKINGVTKSLHRFLMEPVEDGLFVDHKDRDGLNCRRSNLRCVTKSISAINRKGWHNKRVLKTGQSHFKGVFKRNKRWASVITFNKIRHDLGTFDSEEAAAKAYDQKALELHKEYAVLNFPEDDRVEGPFAT